MGFGGRLNPKYHNSRLTSASQGSMPSSPTPRRTRLPASPPTRLRQLRATSSLLDFAKRQCLFCRKDANRAKLPWSSAHRNALDRLLRIAPPVDYGDGSRRRIRMIWRASTTATSRPVPCPGKGYGCNSRPLVLAPCLNALWDTCRIGLSVANIPPLSLLERRRTKPLAHLALAP
jgi:hypothetical protein